MQGLKAMLLSLKGMVGYSSGSERAFHNNKNQMINHGDQRVVLDLKSS